MYSEYKMKMHVIANISDVDPSGNLLWNSY